MENDARIEQAEVDLPQVIIYTDGVSAEELSGADAYLGQEKLEKKQDAQCFADTGKGIDYCVLLDISASIKNDAFTTLKAAIQKLGGNLRENDRLFLYTFGDDVTKAADGSQNAEELASVLADIQNDDQETALFDAIYQSAKDLTSAENGNRQVMAVMTDGEDFATGKIQSAEALAELNDRGIPVYAFAMKDTKKEYINSFSEFARNTGGDMVVFDSTDGENVLTDLCSELLSGSQAEYEAANNIVSHTAEPLSLKFADGTVLKLKHDVMVDSWVADTQCPYLVTAEAVSSTQFRLSFSESLTGLDSNAAYEMTNGEESVQIESIAYDPQDASVLVITLKSPAVSGDYELDLKNVTDISMEKNAISAGPGETGDGKIQFFMDVAAEEPSDGALDGQASGTGLIAILAGAAFFVIFIIILLAVLLSRKKENKEQEGTDTQEMRLNGSFKSQQRLKSASEEKRTLYVTISKNGSQPAQTTWDMGRSLIVGRAETCDIVIEDRRISKQHFCLEREGGEIFISDLGSSNGTLLNGIRLSQKRKMASGDVITAGPVRIAIRWV